MRKITRQKPKYVEISMLNLIDVIFILLVFFMLTTTFKKYWHFDIELPKQSIQEEIKEDKDSIEVMLNVDNQIYIKQGKDFVNIDESSLAKFLNGYKIAVLNADKNLSYDKIISLITLIKNTNINTIKLNIEK